jgi:hypothetical protein
VRVAEREREREQEKSVLGLQKERERASSELERERAKWEEEVAAARAAAASAKAAASDEVGQAQEREMRSREQEWEQEAEAWRQRVRAAEAAQAQAQQGYEEKLTLCEQDRDAALQALGQARDECAGYKERVAGLELRVAAASMRQERTAADGAPGGRSSTSVSSTLLAAAGRKEGEGGGAGAGDDAGEEEGSWHGCGVADILHHDVKHTSADDCLSACASEYRWDLRLLVASLELDLYSCIRLANFLRREVAQQRAVDATLTDEELLRRLQLPFANATRPAFLDDDALLYPFLEDDELLSALCRESMVQREVPASRREAPTMPRSQRQPLQDAEGSLLWEAGSSRGQAGARDETGSGSMAGGVELEDDRGLQGPVGALGDAREDSDALSSAGSSLCVSPRLLAAHSKHRHEGADGGGDGKGDEAEAGCVRLHVPCHLAAAEAAEVDAHTRVMLGASPHPPSARRTSLPAANPSLALPDLPSHASTNSPLIVFPNTPASSILCEPHRTDSAVSGVSLLSKAIVTPATPCSPPTPHRPVPSPPNPTPVSLLPGLPCSLFSLSLSLFLAPPLHLLCMPFPPFPLSPACPHRGSRRSSSRAQAEAMATARKRVNRALTCGRNLQEGTGTQRTATPWARSESARARSSAKRASSATLSATRCLPTSPTSKLLRRLSCVAAAAASSRRLTTAPALVLGAMSPPEGQGV